MLINTDADTGSDNFDRPVDYEYLVITTRQSSLIVAGIGWINKT